MSRLLPFIAVAALLLAGCGSNAKPVNPNSAENSPPGDIPDNQAYVAYSPPGGGYRVKVPEGWARTSAGGAVTFTDKLNSIRMESVPAHAAPTVATAKRTLLPQLQQRVHGFALRSVSTVERKAGTAIRIAYGADAPASAVTNRAGQDDVERYVFFHNGEDVVLTLSGPKGADNVDPWRLVTDSLRWSR
jgi:hypothetical protein